MTDLFRRAGHALYGDTEWRQAMAHELGVNVSTVKNIARGASRVPPGLWRDVARLLHEESARLLALKSECLNAAVLSNWNKDQPTNKEETKP